MNSQQILDGMKGQTTDKRLPRWMQHAGGAIPHPTPEEVKEDFQHERAAADRALAGKLTAQDWRDHEALMAHYAAIGQEGKPPAGGLMSGAATYLASIDWKRVFIVAVITVNVLAVIYGLSKIGAAYAIGGAVYAVVTGGTTVAYMLFFAAFAVVMIRKYEGYSMLATVMTLLCAFVI